MPGRVINSAGLELIKSFESLRLEAYHGAADRPGLFTIGWGHCGDVKPGDRITEHQAEAILSVDLDKFERGVADLTKGITLSDNEFSALVSLSFNIGLGNLASSSLLKYLKAGKPRSEVAAEFLKWRMAGGKVFPGLVRRRAAERSLFLKP